MLRKVARRKTDGDKPRKDPALSRRRNDDREEHSVECNAEGAHKTPRHQISRKCAECRSDCPARKCDCDRPVHVPRTQITGSCDRNTKQLIRDIKRHQKSVEKRHLRVHPLAHRTAHQKIPRIRDQRHDRHLQISSPGRDHRKSGIFSG